MAGEETGDNPVTKGAEVDLDAVKAEIMEEVEALRERRGGAAWAPEPSKDAAAGQPADEIMRILSLDDVSFLKAAYEIVLGRPVDSVGYVDAMDRLIEGESRIDVLWSLAESSEARSSGVDPSALLGERSPASSTQRPTNRTFLRRIASWAMGLRQAPARIATLGHDLRRLSLKGDWLLSQSAALEASRAEMTSAMDQQARSLRADLELELDERLGRLQQAWEAVSEGIQRQLDVAAEQCRDLVVSAGASASEARNSIDGVRQLERRLLMDECRLVDAELRLRRGRVGAVPAQGPGPSPMTAGQTDRSDELLYLALEDAFRGTDATIRSRLEEYVGRVSTCGAGTEEFPVIDLGCGRGEWLQLLKEQGYVARGVDSSSVMTELCNAHGLDVECSDAAEYLSRMKPASAGMITAFHVIEHMPFEQLLRLVDLSLRALRPGGVLVLETPNPENIVVATCNFYVDPTHIRPIPPDLLGFLVRARGFGDVETLRLHPLEMVRQDEEPQKWLGPVLDRFNCSQDYAVVAVRPTLVPDDQRHDDSHGSPL